MHILGISAYGLESAAVLLRDGEVVCAAQEEWFTRTKRAGVFPAEAVRFCLETGGVKTADVELIGFDEKPLWSFERQIETHLAVAPAGFGAFRGALPSTLAKRMTVARELDKALGLSKKRYVFVDRHEAHAAAAFFTSPFDEAALLTIDGAGEWATMALGRGKASSVRVTHELRHPHSLGLLGAAFCELLGFPGHEGAAQVADLAAFGEPRFASAILEKLVQLEDDGSFRVDPRYFELGRGRAVTTPAFHELFGGAPRHPDEEITQRHKDLAASIERATQDIVLRAVRHLHATTKLKRLAISSSSASSAALHGRIVRESPFEDVWIQPAPGDAGSALGVALLIHHQLLGNERKAGDRLGGALLGPRSTMAQVERVLRDVGTSYDVVDDAERDRRVASLLADGKVVAWFQGRMEYGAQGLGGRSFLADPRRAGMRKRMNLRVKFRAPYRAVTASVLAERASEWFDVPARFSSPHMLAAAALKDGRRSTAALPAKGGGTAVGTLEPATSTLPAITDGASPVAIQTVDAERHPALASLLRAFERATGCPVLVNTSFNLSGEPLVATPQDAWRTFMSSDADVLVLENAIVMKSTQRGKLEARRVDPATGKESDPAAEDLLRCPACGSEFAIDGDRAVCKGCATVRQREGGIWRMFQPSEPFDGDITQMVKGFYEEHPFPNYDEDESLASIMEKAQRGIYARLLGEQIPFDGRALEVGCGTGQLSNFLGIGCRTVVGADLCGNSLKLAEGFRSRHALEHVRFVQMNLFRPAFAPQSFDVVLCNGVLLTTTDPKSGFESIAKLVKPGGYIVIGLYNTYGRLAVDTRRQFFRLTGGRFRWVDPHLRGQRMSPEKQDAWFYDQYRHPHETKQTMGEVLGWFDDNGFDFVSSVPKTSPWHPFTEREELFRPSPRGTALERGLVQTGMIVTGNREGGFFIMIGRRKSS